MYGRIGSGVVEEGSFVDFCDTHDHGQRFDRMACKLHRCGAVRWRVVGVFVR
jgi:hypothetical protein